ncbi:MAG TPA: M48 family metalloprotease [Pyrinomonadaceae bacterium]|jgi:WD40 repeat protein
MTPRKKLRALPCALLLACLSAASARAQQQPPPPCQQPAVSAASRAQSIFTPRQEMELGDVIAEHVQQDYRLLSDPETTGFLRRVGERLVAQLPPSEMRYQFFVVDLPDANAFTMPGGRIYVTRKLIAFAASEDELAGVLAHELGHAASGQLGADMTRLFREVLGATTVSDRRDIFEKYNRILDNAARKPGAWKRGDREEEGQQYEADRIGIYSMAAAGYDPQAFVSLWNRLTDVKGKTGGWLSDLFGTTRPESRRLREILKGVSTLPAQCVAARAAAAPEEFKRWQAAVVSLTAAAPHEESLHAVLSKTKLDPPLRGDINYLRFSPDGRYIISQDDGGIDIVTREPLAHLLHIDAPEAKPAQFTPDSKAVVFYNRDLRVEEWDVAAKKMKSAKELYAREGCIQTALAPDGRTLACLDGKFALTLYDVEKGEPFYTKKEFYKPDFNDLWRLIFYQVFEEEGAEFDWVSMAFSPDARYFAAGQLSLTLNALGFSNQLSTVALDLAARAPVPVNDNVKRLLGNRFVFLGPDRILGLHTQDSKKSGVVTFPAGEVVEQFPLAGRLAPVTRGDYVLISGLVTQSGPRMSVLVFDLKTKKFVRGSRTPAADVYDRWTVGERVNGELALYEIDKNEAVGTVLLPRNPLGRLRAAAVSPNLKWLAVSERNRGAVWDLSQGGRVFHVRGFRAAHFAADGGAYVDFPKYEEAEHMVARLDLLSGKAFEHRKLGEAPVWQRGVYSVLRKPLKKDGGLDRNVTLSVSDAVTGAPMWSRDFPREAPRVFVEEYAGTMVFSWNVKSDQAKAEIKADPKLKERLAAMGEKEGDYFIQTVEAKTGNTVSTLLVETGKGSFRIDDMFAAGDWLVVSDTSKRVLLYSLATGEQKGKFFGRAPAISKEAGLLSVETGRGELTLFDPATGERRDRFDFAAPVSLAHFSGDGKRLLVLTADQTVYLLDLTAKVGQQ